MENIKLYYQKDINLETLMHQQTKELNVQQEELKLKVSLCEDIKDSHSPLISYTVDQYDEIIHHQRSKTPYQAADSLITSWNQEQSKDNRSKFMIVCSIFFVILGFSIVYAMLLGNLETADYTIYTGLEIVIMIVVFAFAGYLVYLNFRSITISELYEFRETGIYYISKEMIKSKAIKKTINMKKLHNFMSFLSYEDIEVLKV